jgi:drug/metabolite transporter, DME family
LTPLSSPPPAGERQGEGARPHPDAGVERGEIPPAPRPSERERETPDERRGILLVAAAALLWSAGGLGIKAVEAPAAVVAFYRSAFAAVALAALFRPRRFPLRPGFLVAVASYAGCLITFVVATKWTTAANAIFLQYSGVVWVLLAAPAVLGEPRRRRDLVAIGVALVGMALFFVGRLDLRGRAGDGVALLSSLLFAVLVLSLRRERGAAAESAVTFGNLAAALALLPFVAGRLAVSSRSLLVLAVLGFFQLAGAYALFVRGLRHVAAAKASLIGMLEPIANPIWVAIGIGERPSGFAVAGGAIVLGAIAWRTLASGAPAPEAAPPD